MKLLLISLFAAALLTGCATSQRAGAGEANTGEHEARITRGVIDPMFSPAHRFPANIPR